MQIIYDKQVQINFLYITLIRVRRTIISISFNPELIPKKVMERINEPDTAVLNPKPGLFFPGLIIFFIISYNSSGQDSDSVNNVLLLKDKGLKIENTISLYTSRAKYQALKTSQGTKILLDAGSVVINGDTVTAQAIKTRGQSTLNFRRKSLSFSLKSNASFNQGEKKESLKKFYALSLCMDKDYINNRMAFEMMEHLGIFSLFHTFCEMRINDQSEGIYLVIERPEDWAIKKKGSPIIIRRGYNQSIDKIGSDEKTGKDEIRKHCENFKLIYKYLGRYEGEELYGMISPLIDLEHYMKWLGFNFLVRNGDYTDEVHFYYDRSNNKFGIIPWDYDDLFFSAPHEGSDAKAELIGSKLLFSAEDLLDKKIANDPFFYDIYLANFQEILIHLSPEVLRKIFEKTFAELYPYYSDEAIIGMSEYDAYHSTNLEKLKNDMTGLFLKINFSRDRYLDYIARKKDLH